MTFVDVRVLTLRLDQGKCSTFVFFFLYWVPNGKLIVVTKKKRGKKKGMDEECEESSSFLMFAHYLHSYTC